MLNLAARTLYAIAQHRVPGPLSAHSQPHILRGCLKRKLHIYTHGEGFLGCLGHGDFRKQVMSKRVEALSSLEIRSASAGWTHSAATCSEGRLIVWGRPYDFKNSLRMNNINKVFPPMIPAINAFANAGEVMPYPTIVPVRTPAQTRGQPWDSTTSTQSTRFGQRAKGSSHASRTKQGDGSSAPPTSDIASAPASTSPVSSTAENGEIFASTDGGTQDVRGPKAVSVTCSAALTVILTERGRVYCMGQNRWGQCAQGEAGAMHVFEPVLVKGRDLGKERVVKVAVGFQHCLVLCESGLVFGWGKGERGQLGTGDDANETVAARVALSDRAVDVSSGFNHGVAVMENGDAYIWGKMQNIRRKEDGGMVEYHDQLIPRKIEFAEEGIRVKEAVCSSFQTVLRSDDGRVFMCGMERDSRRMVHTPIEADIPSSSTCSFLDGFNDTVIRGTGAPGEQAFFTLSLTSEGTVYAPLVLPGFDNEDKVIAGLSVGWQHTLVLVD